MITFWKLYTKSAPFFKFPPKTKRALLILRTNQAKPFPTGSKDGRRSMETQKFVLTFYPKNSNITGTKIANKKGMFTFVRTICVRDQKWTSLLDVPSTFDLLNLGLSLFTNPRKTSIFRSQVSTIPFWHLIYSLILFWMSSSGGSYFSKSLGRLLVTRYSLTPIGLLMSFLEYSATKLFLLLQSSRPMVALSCGCFKIPSTADK